MMKQNDTTCSECGKVITRKRIVSGNDGRFYRQYKFTCDDREIGIHGYFCNGSWTIYEGVYDSNKHALVPSERGSGLRIRSYECIDMNDSVGIKNGYQNWKALINRVACEIFTGNEFPSVNDKIDYLKTYYDYYSPLMEMGIYYDERDTYQCTNKVSKQRVNTAIGRHPVTINSDLKWSIRIHSGEIQINYDITSTLSKDEVNAIHAKLVNLALTEKVYDKTNKS